MRLSDDYISADRQHGMALIAVLWITAALAMVAMSLSHMTRNEIRVVEVFKQMTIARAEADGALQVAASWMIAHAPKVKGVTRLHVPIGGDTVDVRIVPVTGLIDINHADVGLLKAMFQFGASLPVDRAAILAQRVVDWRAATSAVGEDKAQQSAYEAAGLAAPRHGPFRTPEDIRQVLGVTPDIYAKVSRLIVAHPSVSHAGVAPASAPLGVVHVLAKGNAQVVARIAQMRKQKQPKVDYSGLNQKYLGGGAALAFRLDAMVSSPDGRNWARTGWLDITARRPGQAPWNIWQLDPLVRETRE